MKKSIKGIRIVGKRWFQRSYGNTYHTAEIIAPDGKKIKSGIRYGYEDAYLQTAADLLRKNGYDLPADSLESFKTVTTLEHGAEDVTRKKDL